MDFTIPEPLTLEHQALHRDLRTAVEAGGAIAEAARALVAVLHPHFVREEQIAMPPLALLRALSRGEFRPEMAEGRPDVAEFADGVVLHARTEEEVLYPASLMVGDWVRRQAGRAPT